MPYDSLNGLEKNVKGNLPPHAQEIYNETFNNAWEQYIEPDERKPYDATREEIADRVAWAAVKKKYKKSSNGKWIRK